MSVKRAEIIAYLNEMAPENIAESWDNSGLLLGAFNEDISKIVICLDVTGQVVDEACRIGADLIIAHHPLLFSPIKRIDTETTMGTVLFKLIQSNINVYCAHTNVDKTDCGLNDLLAGIIGLRECEALDAVSAASFQKDEYIFSQDREPKPYRIGEIPNLLSLRAFSEHVASTLKQDAIMVSDLTISGMNDVQAKLIKRVAVMCGSYDIPMKELLENQVDAVVCGEIKHHQVLELIALGIFVVSAGHHGTERFFVHLIEKWLKEKYTELDIKYVGFESYPLQDLLYFEKR